MNIFTKKVELLNEIKSQEETIQDLKSTNEILNSDISELEEINSELNEEIEKYKRKYIDTHIECYLP